MSLDLKNIKKNDVLKAAKSLTSKVLKNHPTIGYEVIIENNSYSPRALILTSYRIANNVPIRNIYEIQLINETLEKLGFVIKPLNKIWKLGCNWGSNAPSFYNFINEEEIVIGVNKYPYSIGDLVLITEGFTVFALAKIVSNPEPIRNNLRYKQECIKLEIDYDESVTFSKAEWFELPETDVFKYQLQQGICEVRNKDIKNKAINIWDDRNRKIVGPKFYLKKNNESASEIWDYPCLVLSPDSWDDFGFKTSFEMYLYKSPSDKTEIGPIKILDKNERLTSLNEEFKTVGQRFISLGQTIEYYKRLKIEFPRNYVNILNALNDIAFNPNLKDRFIATPGYKISLLRSSEAEFALHEAKRITEGNIVEMRHSFSFEYKITNAINSHKVDFSFNKTKDIPNRLFCIVGKNGTGKTKIISQLASKLTNDKEEGVFPAGRPIFSKIITASFSYFDKFKFPEKQDISYDFIGLKSTNGLLSESDTSNLVWNAFNILTNDKRKKNLWVKSIKSSLETEYLDFEFDEFINISTRNQFNKRTEDIFSSGQNIIFQFITRFISVIEENSLLIFDEPETHLHPNIAGRLIRTINNILDDYKSFCILSTHSPVIVQEISSKFIRVFDRKENLPIVYPPTIECLGENLSNISNNIFQTDREKELYKMLLEDLSSHLTLEKIDELFNNNLSLNAKLYLQTIKK